jgi:hypothetical protein
MNRLTSFLYLAGGMLIGSLALVTFPLKIPHVRSVFP